MILNCPNCSARFIVPPQAIGPGGRRVRCARCLNIWHAEFDQENTEIVPEFVDATTGSDTRPGTDSGASDASVPDDQARSSGLSEVEALAKKLANKISGDADLQGGGDDRDEGEPDTPPDDKEEQPQEDEIPRPVTGTTLPALVEPKSQFLAIGWVAWGLFVAAFLFSMYFFRDPIIEAWPASARLYAFAGLVDSHGDGPTADAAFYDQALEIRNQAEPRANADGSFDLVISGTIRNTTTEAITLPRIKGVLRDSDKSTIHEWRVTLSQSVIGPQASIEFRTEVRSAPPQTAEYEIMPDWQR